MDVTRTQMANQDNHEFRSAELLLRSQVQSAPITRVAFPQSDSLLKILALRLRLFAVYYYYDMALLLHNTMCQTQGALSASPPQNVPTPPPKT